MDSEAIQREPVHVWIAASSEMVPFDRDRITMVRATVSTELGTEIQCARCGEFWPCDPEFFFFSKKKPHSWSKACYVNDPKTIAKRVRLQQAEKAKRKGIACVEPDPTDSSPTFNATPLLEALWRRSSSTFNLLEVST